MPANQKRSWEFNCPVSIQHPEQKVTLAHSEGGRLMRQLLEQHIFPGLGSAALDSGDDAARIASPESDRLAITTDSFVVSPLFFPGGDIGCLSVYGTVNDLAVSGATPQYLTLSFLIEEGFPFEVLDFLLARISKAALETGVKVVAGDTKVVPFGAVDGIYINTCGIGVLPENVFEGPTGIRIGDELIVSGNIGQHGLAVLSAREQLELDPPLESDCASLIEPCETLRKTMGDQLVAMRDATRGGVSAVLHEWSKASEVSFAIQKDDLPISPAVRGASELLGLEPLHVANEGTMVIAVRPGSGKQAVNELRNIPQGRNARRIGQATEKGISPVTVEGFLGQQIPLDEPVGALLPRIC